MSMHRTPSPDPIYPTLTITHTSASANCMDAHPNGKSGVG